VIGGQWPEATSKKQKFWVTDHRPLTSDFLEITNESKL